MPGDRPTSESIPLAEWLEKLGGILGPSGGPGATASGRRFGRPFKVNGRLTG
jgi:hypothetical protein